MQMQSNDDETWREWSLSRGHVAVLAGHTLERATCGLINAAKHKVVCPSHVSMDIMASSNIAHLHSSLPYTRLSIVGPYVFMLITVMFAGGWWAWRLSNSS